MNSTDLSTSKQRLIVVGNGMVGHHCVEQLLAAGALAQYQIEVFDGAGGPVFDALNAADVGAGMVLDAVRTQRFWIFSHPQALAGVKQRAEEVLAGKNPGDPFGDHPEIGAQLRAALRAE